MYCTCKQIHERKITATQVLNVGAEPHLVTVSEDQTLCMWRVRTGALVGQCSLFARPTSLQLLPKSSPGAQANCVLLGDDCGRLALYRFFEL